MTLGRKWVVASAVAVAALVVGVLWVSSELSKCKYGESSPSYSPDTKFYFQVQFMVCRDSAKSHASLVMGEAGKSNKAVLLDFGSSIGEVHASWREGPELHVQASDSAITKRYGPYDDLPRVVVTNP
jgi:hypothetical protein